jgi:hypothetical protein
MVRLISVVFQIMTDVFDDDGPGDAVFGIILIIISGIFYLLFYLV